jgi:hypothetical protein
MGRCAGSLPAVCWGLVCREWLGYLKGTRMLGGNGGTAEYSTGCEDTRPPEAKRAPRLAVLSVPRSRQALLTQLEAALQAGSQAQKWSS